mmetsp:Transcript_3023/g.8527  ORF Transcript_3023/g.8527 Transcript_3023/m.8527 type:complete len:881 (-) Transcript_3023:425-3067(-)
MSNIRNSVKRHARAFPPKRRWEQDDDNDNAVVAITKETTEEEEPETFAPDGLLDEPEAPPRRRGSAARRNGSRTQQQQPPPRESAHQFPPPRTNDSEELLQSEIIDISSYGDDAPPDHEQALYPENGDNEPSNNSKYLANKTTSTNSARRQSWTSLGVGTAADEGTILVLPSLCFLVVFGLLAVALGAVGTALGIYNTIDNNQNDSKTLIGTTETAAVQNSTLDTILERGYIRCGTGPEGLPGFLLQQGNGNDDDDYAGLEMDLCLVLAAALFDGETERSSNGERRYRIVPTSFTQRFDQLAAGEIDVLFRTTYNMERNVQGGMEFSTPYFLDGMSFGGLPEHVACAEALDFNSTPTCQATKICVAEGSSHVVELSKLLQQLDPPDVAPGESMVDQVLRLEANIIDAFPDTLCQVMASEQSYLNIESIKTQGYQGPYQLGTKQFSREPISMTTRQGDPRWSDFVEWVVQALIFAEEQGITKSRSFLFEPTTIFGGNASHPHPQLANMFENAIAVRGHYGEMYNFNLQTFLPRGGMNTLNPGDSPIMFSFPLGDVNVEAPTIETSSVTVQAIKARGFLNCGVSVRKGFAEFNATQRTWSGFDVELCRAISSALFDGVDQVVFTDLPAAQRFDALVSGRVDILARLTTHTLSRDVKEPSTQTGLSFSSPYFHDGLKFGGLGTYAQCADNRDVISPECQDLRICVLEGTTILTRVQDIFQDVFIVPKLTFNEIIAALNDEQGCNAVAGGFHDVALQSIEERGYVGNEPYLVGENLFSKDPLALTTRQTDPLWSSFVRWIFWALVYAEENGVPQATANQMPATKLFGALRTNALYHAVNAVGNYGELYDRNFNQLVPRGGLHRLNVEFGPMLRALPGISTRRTV